MEVFYLAGALSFLCIIYAMYTIIWRLYLCPIAHFPGRRLAALTHWYKGYFDVVLRGQYTKEIGKMHAEYGPIVRISPFEIHIHDPEFIDSVYCLGKRVDKWSFQTRQFPVGNASFGTIEHNLHHARRAPVAPFFSKRAV